MATPLHGKEHAPSSRRQEFGGDRFGFQDAQDHPGAQIDADSDLSGTPSSVIGLERLPMPTCAIPMQADGLAPGFEAK
jgi:hypothetical protein